MPDAISELLLTEAAIDKLGVRGIAIEEIHQLVRNANVTVRNPRSDPPGKRRLMIGRTDGGRALTLVVERTSDPRTWLPSRAGMRRRASVDFSGADAHGSVDRP